MGLGPYALTNFTAASSMFGYLADQQTRIEKIIEIATARIEKYTRRRLKERTHTDIVLDGPGGSVLMLPEYPISSITSIIPDSGRTFDVGGALDASSYLLYSDCGSLTLLNGSWPSVPGSIKVSYVAGYGEDHEDYPILEGACLAMVQWLHTRFTGYIGKRSETNADGMNVGYEIEMPLDVQRDLERFVRYV